MKHLISPEETAAAEILRQKIAEIKVNCFDYLDMLSRMTEEDKKHSGYEKYTIAEAMKESHGRSQQKIKKLIDAHIKQFPD